MKRVDGAALLAGQSPVPKPEAEASESRRVRLVQARGTYE